MCCMYSKDQGETPSLDGDGGFLYLILAVEWIWIDTNLQLFDLNMQIFIITEIDPCC